jgi:hypothetical protein
MIVIPADPSIDPRIAVTPSLELGEGGRPPHYTLRLLPPPICHPQQ